MKYIIGLFLLTNIAIAKEAPVLSIGDLRQHHCHNEISELEKTIHELAQRGLDYSLERELLAETQERCDDLDDIDDRRRHR